MKIAASVKGLCVSFGKRQVLHEVDFCAPAQGITVLAGRSGSGKTTLLRALNRLNETFPLCETRGVVTLDLGNGLEAIYSVSDTSKGRMTPRPLNEIRRLVGMVFQTPNVLPVSIAQNIALPLKVVTRPPASEIADRMQQALMDVGLWDEVADRLEMSAEGLSGGQQQRLCMARALALEPAILLLDEPTASLDTQAAVKIEDLLLSLAERIPLIVVSHNPRQAVRLASRLIILQNGTVQHAIENECINEEDFCEIIMDTPQLP